MALSRQLRSYLERLSILLCIIALLCLYHFHGVPPMNLDPVTEADVAYLGLDSPNITSGHQHPIEVLVDDASQKYSRMLANQSKSLEQAIANYKKRYHREPPPGFDDWYRLAVELNATIIDEYDTVMAAFEPYWGISARELRARVREVLDPRYLEGRLFGIQVKDHQIFTLNDETAMNRMHLSR